MSFNRKQLDLSTVQSIAVLALCAMPLVGEARTLQVRVGCQVGEAALTPGEGSERVDVTRCDTLLSNFRIRESGGEWRKLEHFGEDLVYASAAGQMGITTFEKLPPGDFTAIAFDVGVSKEIDESDPAIYPANHPLNPKVNGLHWGWQGGYIYLALEGHYTKKSGERGGFSYHIANQENVMHVEVAAKFSTIRDCTLEIEFNVAKVLSGIDIERDGEATHSRKADALAARLKANAEKAFTLKRITRELFQELPVAKSETTGIGHPYELRIPKRFPKVELPADNLPTIEGVALGKHLFSDKRLSKNDSQSCASCHESGRAFTDGKKFSVGVAGIAGKRNAMPLTNLLWEDAFFWDGRAKTLREQVLMPIKDAHEMNASLPAVVKKLSAEKRDREQFAAAFGDEKVTAERIARALEQYLFTELSSDSRFDRAMRREVDFTAEEKRGFELFVTEFDPKRGLKGADCFHCHGGSLFTNHKFANNGLDAEFADLGRYLVTGKDADKGMFKVPSLRNVALTAPYMHDGRFDSLVAVIDHYDSGIKRSDTLDPNIAKHPVAGLGLSAADKRALVTFLRTLTDTRFLETRKQKHETTSTAITQVPTD